ncbi:protein of unknown function [Methylophaga sulfidovorans]|uniref:DUF4276 family protein n=2 Tax=Methylophaga sulfidovorans TaxID=45496 RepID=A0A1I3VLX7_9GAMM|nr:protein of unknown function [Methylophaga sulfidovorans]
MFVNEVLCEPLAIKGIYLYPSLVGKPGHKGGNFKYERVLRDIRNRLLDDENSFCTTFFDFYGLPEDFPGKQEALSQNQPVDKSRILIEHFLKKLKEDIGDDALTRFIPYIQLYEFEALLFSCPASIASEIGSQLEQKLIQIRNAFQTPEHINNSPVTAPSKRIMEICKSYDKVLHGSLIAMDVGVERMREECILFNEWMSRLQALSV